MSAVTPSTIPIEKKQLTEAEASVLYGLSVHWFRRKRWEGGGVPFRKIGNRCFYARNELEKFFNGQTKKNTSEYQTRRPDKAISAKREGIRGD